MKSFCCATRLKLSTLFIVSVLLSPVAAIAENKPNCVSPGDALEQNECFRLDYEASDKALNNAYEAAKKRIDGEFGSHVKEAGAVKHQLLLAQRSWLKFRDEECKLQAALTEPGSSANTTETLICFTQLNKSHTEQLNRTFND